eukprot:767429-Hanusia_phi.AAC.8
MGGGCKGPLVIWGRKNWGRGTVLFRVYGENAFHFSGITVGETSKAERQAVGKVIQQTCIERGRQLGRERFVVVRLIHFIDNRFDWIKNEVLKSRRLMKSLHLKARIDEMPSYEGIRLTMYNSIVNVVHMEELFANYGKKKKQVQMNTVPDFKDAIQNPEQAMAQILAMSLYLGPASDTVALQGLARPVQRRADWPEPCGEATLGY